MERKYFVSYSVKDNINSGFGDFEITLKKFDLGKVKEAIIDFLEKESPVLCNPSIVVLFFTEID